MTRRLIEHRSIAPGATLTEAGVERRSTGLLEVRADGATDGPDGADFWGYLLPFNTLDSYGTRFAPDAFRDGGVDADPYALLWMHDPWTVAGQFTAEVRDAGIWIAGTYDDTPDGNSARARGKSGSARGLSIGFERIGDEEQDDGSILITKARMVEGSQITTRMESVPGAGLAGVRRALPRDAGAQQLTVPQWDAAAAAAVAARLRLSHD